MTINGIETCFLARVGTEPEVKTSAAGKPWAALNVVVGDKDDEQQWIRLVVFGDRATQLAVSKGDRVYVEGRLKLDNWTSKTGEAKSGLKVAAWKVERLGEIGKNKPAANTQGDSTPAQARSRPAASRANFDKPVDDEIPF
jgi:single-strand DNA-binding protein